MKIYNSLDLRYKSPFGAIKVDEIVTVRLAFEKFKKVTYPFIYICEIDKWNEFTSYELTYERQEDGLIWFTTSFSIKKAAVHFYFFKFTIDGCEFELKKGKNLDSILDRYGDLFQLTVYSKEAITEDNYKGGIMYQIFPDRFYNSGSKKTNIPTGRKLRQDWGSMPEYLPDNYGIVLNNDYFCGDLQGITLKLDYLVELGVTAIYLNPIFEAHSNHRYDTADYLKIDPLLGIEEEFTHLCNEAKKRGIAIILDGVFSHTGSDSIYFNKYCRYDSLGAYNSVNSKYFEWYNFNNHPNSYKSWWGFDTLPELNKDNESLIEFVCGDNGVISKWIKAGAYGFRLDVVDELNQHFLEKIKEATVKYGGKILIGEVWEDASTKRSYGYLRQYLLGYELDSTMNYPFRNAILSYVRYGCSEYFYTTVMSLAENYPKEVLDSTMNMLSTHDTERAITKLVKEEVNNSDRYWQVERNSLTFEEYNFGKVLLKLASLIQYFMPGLPCIYYGDEAGLYGYKDPFNRGCYPWGNEDNELITFFKELGKLRIENTTLKKGSFKVLSVDENVLVLERFDEVNSLVVSVNRSNTMVNISNILGSITGYEIVFQIGECNNLELSGYSAIVMKR